MIRLPRRLQESQAHPAKVAVTSRAGPAKAGIRRLTSVCIGRGKPRLPRAVPAQPGCTFTGTSPCDLGYKALMARGHLAFRQAGTGTAVETAYAESPLRFLTPRNHGTAA